MKNSWSRIIALFIAQIFGTTGSILVAFTGGLAGMQLTSIRALATAPVAAMVTGTALFAIPSALLMKKIGRKKGNLLAAGAACMAALCAAFAIQSHQFWLFCVATFIIGANSAFVQQYRFAVVEAVEPQLTARALSFLLFGTMISAYIGTQFATWSREWFATTYVGSYVTLALMLGVSILALTFYHEPPLLTSLPKAQAEQFKPIIGQNLIPAIIIATCSYGLMSLIMVATPVALHVMHHLSIHSTTMVMQSHLLAMYLPSLFVGFLAQRWGNLRVVVIGIMCFVGCIAMNYTGITFTHALIALILLGIGWNFSFICATTILTESYLLEYRFKYQAINDFFVFGLTALTSLSAGTLVLWLGWRGLNLVGIVWIVILLVATTMIYRNNRRHGAHAPS